MATKYPALVWSKLLVPEPIEGAGWKTSNSCTSISLAAQGGGGAGAGTCCAGSGGSTRSQDDACCGGSGSMATEAASEAVEVKAAASLTDECGSSGCLPNSADTASTPASTSTSASASTAASSNPTRLETAAIPATHTPPLSPTRIECDGSSGIDDGGNAVNAGQHDPAAAFGRSFKLASGATIADYAMFYVGWCDQLFDTFRVFNDRVEKALLRKHYVTSYRERNWCRLSAPSRDSGLLVSIYACFFLCICFC